MMSIGRGLDRRDGLGSVTVMRPVLQRIPMTQAIAYLNFNGTCAEAFRFYEQALGGKLEVLMSGAQSPMATMIPPEFADRILHARLVLPGGGMLYGGDCPAHLPYDGIKGVAIAVDYDTEEAAQAVFDALAQGGQITMPMQPAFWAKRWGMVVDRFGTPWTVSGVLIPVN
jgi:PhnB protein